MSKKMEKRIELTDKQKEFIWLAHGEGVGFDEIANRLNVDRKDISTWEIELKSEWNKIAAVRKIYMQKNLSTSFNEFFEWYMNLTPKCDYCGITEEEIKRLFEQDPDITKRNRGRKLEIDRKLPNSEYDDLTNNVLACYWCNNAKTDTFSYGEFKKIGKVINTIWTHRLSK